MAKRNGNRNEMIFRMYEEGTSVADIVEATELSYDWVLRLLKSKGFYKKPMKLHADKSAKKDLLNLIEGIKEDKQVSKPKAQEKFIKKEGTHVAAFKLYDKTFDTYGEMREYKKQMGIRVRLLATDGKTSEEIAEITGLNKKSIARFMLTLTND
ncbi:MAG: hypothetical protein IPJ79_06470 [Bacteroidetes bacterium]|nr:hypothetical protein [Bacteroidota bacterium]